MIMIAKADEQMHQRKKSFSGVAATQSSTPLAGSRANKLDEIASSTIDTAKQDETKKAEKRLAQAIPTPQEVSIAKLIKQGPSSNPYKLEEKDMNDFRIPVNIFRKYSSIMKSLNNEVQKSFLLALDVDADDKYSKIGWEKFVQLNCLLKINTATLDDYIAFFQKVIDPRSQR